MFIFTAAYAVPAMIKVIFKWSKKLFIETKDQGTSPCRKRALSLDSCDSCLSDEQFFEHQYLQTFVSDYIAECDVGSSPWQSIQGQQICKLPRTPYIGDNFTIHGHVWNLNKNFLYGSIEVPGTNLDHFITNIWSKNILGIISEFRATFLSHINPANPSSQNPIVLSELNYVAFHAVYYKACITRQVYSGPIRDAEAYIPIYDYMCRLIKQENITMPIVPDFEYLHDINGGAVDNHQVRLVRAVTVDLAKSLARLGFGIILPFHTPVLIHFRTPENMITSKTFTTTKSPFFRVSWPFNSLFDEIIRFVFDSNEFLPLQVESLTKGKLI